MNGEIATKDEHKQSETVAFLLPTILTNSAGSMNDSHFIHPISESTVYIENKLNINVEYGNNNIDFSPEFKIVSAYFSGYNAALQDLGITMGEVLEMTQEEIIEKVDGKVDKLRLEIKGDIKDELGKLDDKLDKISDKIDSINCRLSTIEANSNTKGRVLHYIITAIITLAAAWLGVHFGK